MGQAMNAMAAQVKFLMNNAQLPVDNFGPRVDHNEEDQCLGKIPSQDHEHRRVG